MHTGEVAAFLGLQQSPADLLVCVFLEEAGLGAIRGCAADRLSERVPVLAAVLDQVGRPLREPPERALDLSGGGARVRIPIELEADDPTTAILRLPDGPPIHVAGHIVRRNDDGTVSLAFDRISPSDRERLIRYVFTRLQTALHVRSGGS